MSKGSRPSKNLVAIHAAKIAALQAKRAAEKATLKALDVELAEAEAARIQARYVEVGKLLEAQGVLWMEDALLMKVLEREWPRRAGEM